MNYWETMNYCSCNIGYQKISGLKCAFKRNGYKSSPDRIYSDDLYDYKFKILLWGTVYIEIYRKEKHQKRFSFIEKIDIGECRNHSEVIKVICANTSLTPTAFNY